MTNYLTIDEVAAILRVEVKTIYNWIYLRKIEHVKLPQGVRFRQEYIEKWLEKRTIKSKS